jgi:hypothetical protein
MIDPTKGLMHARTDYSRCALTPSGSPCGRSTSPAAKLSNRLVVCRRFELLGPTAWHRRPRYSFP